MGTVPGANTLENSNEGYLAAALDTQFSPGAHVGDGNVDLCYEFKQLCHQLW